MITVQDDTQKLYRQEASSDYVAAMLKEIGILLPVTDTQFDHYSVIGE